MTDPVLAAADAIRARLAGRKPTIAIVLGSGLGHLAERVADAVRIPYDAIPGFHVPTVVGHKGELVIGTLGGRQVIAQSGRFHAYEGHSAEVTALPVRVFAALGVRTLLLTNAAGGIR
ncbi:MAG TPA: purine-nucleoside phosphorylase, partial [Gemmatimonadales bacterium]|nr:purine-nucleoside phosphorylase [Gemmatimonadales bacterium]